MKLTTGPRGTGPTFVVRSAASRRAKRRGLPAPAATIFGILSFTRPIGNTRSGGDCLGKSAAHFPFQGATGSSVRRIAAKRHGGLIYGCLTENISGSRKPFRPSSRKIWIVLRGEA